MTYKLIVSGGRNFHNYSYLKREVDHLALTTIHDNIEIVSSGANGADKIGERYAFRHALDLTKFPADWDKYGDDAGHYRNGEMVEHADGAIIFWNNKSKSAEDLIQQAKQAGIDLWIKLY